MEGLTIRKKVTLPPKATSSPASFADTAIGCLIFMGVLVAIPFFLIWLLFVVLRDKFAPPKSAKPIEPRPIVVHKVANNLFPLSYHYVLSDEISEGAYDYFGDDEPLILYQPDVGTAFFQGYFSSFKIEYPTGIFVQKINFDPTLIEVISMPLYFFNYATREAEEIIDLKDYSLLADEQLNHFTIIATREDAEEFAAENFKLEITLTDALYAPPKAY